MLSLHAVVLALQVEHVNDRKGDLAAVQSIKITEDLVGLHLNHLLACKDLYGWSDEYLQNGLVIPIIRKLLNHFSSVNLIKILQRLSSEYELAMAATELKTIEQQATKPEDTSVPEHSPKVAMRVQSIFEKSLNRNMSEFEIHKIPRKSENNIAESSRIRPFANSPTTITYPKNEPTNDDIDAQNKENTKSQLNNASSGDRKAFFYSSFIAGQEKKEPESALKNSKAKRPDNRVKNSSRQETSLSKLGSENSRRMPGRYNRIIKNAHKSKPKITAKGQKLSDSVNVLTPQNLTLASLQRIGMTFGNLSDCGDYDQNHPTYENSHNEFETEASNTFPRKMSQIYVEFDTWNNDVIAAKTPVMDSQHTDEAMPSIDLDN